MQPFRQGLLEGRAIVLSGSLPAAVRDLLLELGARVCELDTDDEERAFQWARSAVPLDALICGHDGEDRLLTSTWMAVRAVATEAFIPRGAGRIVFVAPQRDARPTSAALENLARTLSVEWARFGITTTAAAPGATTTDDQLAQLVAFLCSPAGAYYSGCRFDLGLVGGRKRSR
jgi:hypothetical protein